MDVIDRITPRFAFSLFSGFGAIVGIIIGAALGIFAVVLIATANQGHLMAEAVLGMAGFLAIMAVNIAFWAILSGFVGVAWISLWQGRVRIGAKDSQCEVTSAPSRRRAGA